MKRLFTTIAAALFFSLLTINLIAADQKALDIIRSIDESDRSGTSRIILSMSIFPSDGSQARSFSLISMENESGDSLIEFTEPRTVSGLRVLSKGNSSWVFFPSTGRIRKIGGDSRGGSVQGVGGDFSYSDLGSGSWEEDYQWKLLEETADRWELEGKRKSPDSAYDLVILSIDRKLVRPVRGVFHLASEGGAYKQLDLSGFRDYSGRTRPSKMVMRNLKKGSSTEVLLLEGAFDIPLADSYFDPARFNR